MSVTLTIREVPDTVRNRLADEARHRGQSLQGYLLSLLVRESDFSANREIALEIDRELFHGVRSTDREVDVGAVIRAAREERDAQIMRAVLGEQIPPADAK